MKNQGDNNRNVISDDSDDEPLIKGESESVTYTSEDGQTHEGTIEAVVYVNLVYEIVDDDGNVHKVASSRVRPWQQGSLNVAPPLTAAQPQHQVAEAHSAGLREPNLKKVDRIPLYESVVLLKGPYAGKQGILADGRTSHLKVVVEVDGESKEVHVGSWEDMKLFVDKPCDCQGCSHRHRDGSSPGDGSGPSGKRTKMAY